MKIRLYKNCILSNSYSEVFDTKQKDDNDKTAFDRYLETLEHYDVPYSETEELVYYTNSGSFTFEYSIPEKYTSIYEFNYMRCEYQPNEDGDEIIRYCFIDRITLGNNCATITYTEDVWHSYFNSVRIRKSYLTSSRKLHYSDRDITFYRLPLEYQGNNLPIIKNDKSDANVLNYYIVMQLQTYTLTAGGEASEREVYTVFYSNLEGDGQGRYDIESYFLSPDNLRFLIAKQALQSFEFGRNFSERKYFEVDNITLVPAEFLTKNDEKVTNPVGRVELFHAEEQPPLYAYFFNYWNCFERTRMQGRDWKVYENSINANFKKIGIGTYTSMFAIDNNGSDIPYKIHIVFEDYDFKILLLFQNKVIDITNDFVLDIPFNSVTGDVTAQRKIAKQSRIFNDSLRIANGAVDIASSAIGMSADFSKTSVSQLTKSGRIANNFVARTRRNADYINEGLQGGSGIIGGVTDIASGIFDIVQANKPQYLTSKGTFANSEGLLNASKGLCIYQIDSDNDDIVSSFINNIGYVVYEIVDSEIIDTPFEDYNVIKFDFINIYGNFSQEITNKLKSIFMNGVKIWYTENV